MDGGRGRSWAKEGDPEGQAEEAELGAVVVCNH